MRSETYESLLSERDQIARQVEADDAFVAAMNAAIKSRCVKVKRGTFVDHSPFPPTTRRIRGELITASGCGSPAAMCAEAIGPDGGS